MTESDDVKWLLGREIPRLRRYARSLVLEPVAADDLVQDCLERAMRKRHLWRKEGSLRSWLYRMMYNQFLNQQTGWKRWRQQVSLDNSDILPPQPPTQDHDMACRDVVDALKLLPVEQRAAITLTVVEGLSYDQAASIAGVAVGTLRSRLSRGREKLRSLVDQKSAPVRLRRVK